MLDQFNKIGDIALASGTAIVEAKEKVTKALGKLGFKQESDEARLLRDEHIDQSGYLALTAGQGILKVFMEREKTSQGIVRGVENIATQMQSITLEMVKGANRLLEGLDKNVEDLIKTLDTKMYELAKSDFDYADKIYLKEEKLLELDQQIEEKKITQEVFERRKALIEAQLKQLQTNFNSEQEYRKKILDLIQRHQDLINLAIKNNAKQNEANRLLANKIMEHQQRITDNIGKLFSDISNQNSGALNKLIDIGAKYVENKQRHEQKLELLRQDVKPSELSASGRNPQLEHQTAPQLPPANPQQVYPQQQMSQGMQPQVVPNSVPMQPNMQQPFPIQGMQFNPYAGMQWMPQFYPYAPSMQVMPQVIPNMPVQAANNILQQEQFMGQNPNGLFHHSGMPANNPPIIQQEDEEQAKIVNRELKK